jgi:hypothetical protein
VSRPWLAAFVLAAACPAAAEEAATPASSPVPKVDITVVGSPGEFRWARSLAGANFAGTPSSRWTRVERFDVRDLFEDVAARENVLACWLDLSDTRRGRLYFAAPSGQRFLLRDVQLSGHLGEVDRATLAEVLDLSIAALLENERIGLTRAETETLLAERKASESAPRVPAESRAPAPAGSPVADTAAWKSAPETRSLAGFAANYAAQVLSSDFPLAQRVGIEALLGRYRGAGWLAGFAAGEYQFPLTATNREIGVNLETLAASAGVEVGHLRRRPGEAQNFSWRSLFGRLGAGVDFDHVSPQPGTQAVAANLAPAHWSSSVVMRAALGGAFTLGPWFTMDVRLFADLHPTGVHYDVSIAGAVHPAFSPWRLRPGLALGLAFR